MLEVHKTESPAPQRTKDELVAEMGRLGNRPMTPENRESLFSLAAEYRERFDSSSQAELRRIEPPTSRRSQLLHDVGAYGNGYVPQTTPDGEIKWVKNGSEGEFLSLSEVSARLEPLVAELKDIISKELSAPGTDSSSTRQGLVENAQE